MSRVLAVLAALLVVLTVPGGPALADAEPALSLTGPSSTPYGAPVTLTPS